MKFDTIWSWVQKLLSAWCDDKDVPLVTDAPPLNLNGQWFTFFIPTYIVYVFVLLWGRELSQNVIALYIQAVLPISQHNSQTLILSHVNQMIARASFLESNSG